MAIFKKLNIGDAVATSGTRAFRKLTTELPIWNGADLTGTAWRIKSGWSAEAGHGEFDVNGKQCVLTGGAVRFNYYSLCVGYAVANSVGTPYTSANSLCWNGGLETTVYGSITDTTKELEFSFTGGTDVTNSRLIDWLLENGTLISHQYPIKGFWRLNETITQLPDEYVDGDSLRIGFRFGGARVIANEIYSEMWESYNNIMLVYATMFPLNAYNFGTNAWTVDRARYLMFAEATVTNGTGEDVTPMFYKYLTANATKPCRITFTIDGETYQADEGMDWYQWARSDYDSGGYKEVSNGLTNFSVGKDGYNGKKVHTDSGQVDPIDAIIAGYDYVLK